MIYISLGSNCSVCWWLNKLGLRKTAYPFDWASLTIKHLNTILGKDFANYVESLKLKFISDKHPDKDGNPSALITNIYNVKFAHEVITSDIENFKLSLNNRVGRFRDLGKEEFITYVRIELQIVMTSYVKKLQELIKLLDIINPNYIIQLIIHKDSIKITLDKVKIYYFDEFSPDWKMEHIDWKSILTN
jgi:hypothetical protein